MKESSARQSESPLVSVIIPTIRRDEYLVNTVKDVLAEPQPPLEIIIIDSGGTALSALRAAGLEIDDRLMVIYLPIPNLNLVRNTGLHYARGDLVLMLDDDIAFEPGLVNEHVLAHRDPQVGAVVGRIEEEGAVYFDRPNRMQHFGEIKLSGRAHPHRGGYDHSSIAGTLGSNVSFKREIVEQVGGYDLRFDGVGPYYDDIDIGYRVRALGYQIAFRAAAFMVHYKAQRGGTRQRGDSKIDTQVKRIRNITLFYLKNMPRWGLPFFVLTFTAIAAKHALVSKSPWTSFRRLLHGFREGYQMYKTPFRGCGHCQEVGNEPCFGADRVPYCHAASVALGIDKSHENHSD